MFSPMVFSLASFAAAQAQACKPDLLLDDFKKIDYHDYEGANRYFNLVGGDYGAYRADFTYDDKAQKAIIVPTANENFWFSKFDLGACFDLTGYTGIQFDITAPAGSSLTFTLTQKAPDCVDRLIDSEYTPLSKYITPNGQKQTVLQPLSDFSKNLNGSNFDMKHLKDWTAVEFQPLGARFEFSNFILMGNCTPTPTQITTPRDSTGTATPTKSVTNSANTIAAGFGSVLAIVLSVFN